jgi:hypothetical protein
VAGAVVVIAGTEVDVGVFVVGAVGTVDVAGVELVGGAWIVVDGADVVESVVDLVLVDGGATVGGASDFDVVEV